VIRLFEGIFVGGLGEVDQERRISHRLPWPRTDNLAKLLKERFEIFLGRLLTMKADRIVHGPTTT
jgi:hypothetical protein